MNDLIDLARQIRILALKAIKNSGSGHPGGSLSVADLLALLYGQVLRPRPYHPDDPERDVLILDKGHAAPALFAAWAAFGWMPEEDVLTLRKLESPYQGHPARRWTPWCETSTGSLGQGYGLAAGLAYRFKHLEKNGRRVFCILGDGGMHEGVVAETARFAVEHGLTNLITVVDFNRKQSDGHSLLMVKPTREFLAWGFHVLECNGHVLVELERSFDTVCDMKWTRPWAVVAMTVKGKGVSFMEADEAGYHGSLVLSDEELETALKELQR